MLSNQHKTKLIVVVRLRQPRPVSG